MWRTKLAVICLVACCDQISQARGQVSSGDTYLPPRRGYLPPPKASNKYLPPPETRNTYLPPPAASNKYLPPPETSNKYLPPPAASNKYLPPPETSNKYLPPPAASNKYLPPPSPSNKYLPPPTPRNKYLPPSSSKETYSSTNKVPTGLPSAVSEPDDVVVTASVDEPVKLTIEASIDLLTQKEHLEGGTLQTGPLDDTQHAGFCPRQRLRRSCVLVKAAPAACLSDTDCARSQKCCAKHCALQCVDAVISPKTCGDIICNRPDEECVDLDTASESGPVCIGHTKPGQCPYHNQDCPFRNVRCRDDTSCSGDQLCCNLGCGRSCTSPVDTDRKQGFCPPSATYQRPTECSVQCRRDADCAGEHRCCENACGRVCLRAVFPLITCNNRNCPPNTVCQMLGAETVCKAKN